MDILLISKCIVLISLILFMIAALRIGAFKSASIGLLSASAIVVAFALVLALISTIFNINYSKDIVLALILFGFVGTIAFSIVLGEGKND